jgi:hypothetical protein
MPAETSCVATPRQAHKEKYDQTDDLHAMPKPELPLEGTKIVEPAAAPQRVRPPFPVDFETNLN